MREVTAGVMGRRLMGPPGETCVRMEHRLRSNVTLPVTKTFHRNWFSVKEKLHLATRKKMQTWKVLLADMRDVQFSECPVMTHSEWLPASWELNMCFFHWGNYINLGLGYNQQSLFSLWAWSLIFLNDPIVSLSYFVSHCRAFLEVSRVQIRNQ